MSSKAVIILVKSTYSKTPYDKWLAGKDTIPLLIVEEKFYSEYSHIGTAFSVSDYQNDDLIFKIISELVDQYKVISIFARAESDILRAAKFRGLLAIPGQNIESAENYRNKNKMKLLASEQNVKTPFFRCVSDKAALRNFASEVGFPFILKPLMESGSTGVMLIENLNQLEQIKNENFNDALLAEEFINGDLFHVDGFIFGGELVFVQASKYINDNLCYRNDKYMGSVLLNRESILFNKLVAAAQSVIKALGSTPNMVFHGEFWCDEQSDIVLCEIASRTGGGMIATSISEIRGVNLDQVWLQAECGYEPELSVNWDTYGASLWIPPKKGYLLTLPNLHDLDYVVKSDVLGELNKKYYGGEKSGLYLAGYIIRGVSESDAIQNVHRAAHEFDSRVEWSDSLRVMDLEVQ